MRRLSALLALAVLVGCGKKEAQVATDTTLSAPLGAGATAPAISLAEIAGKWAVQTMNMESDSVLVTSLLTLTADGNGSSLTFPGRDPIPATVTPSGDSVISVVGPYESALRKGVQVTTTFVVRQVGTELIGNGVARYSVTGPDSALKLRLKASRVP